MRRRFTPEEAARQLNDAYESGLRWGREKALRDYSYDDVFGFSPWATWRAKAYRLGLLEGKRSRRAELMSCLGEVAPWGPPIGERTPSITQTPKVTLDPGYLYRGKS